MEDSTKSQDRKDPLDMNYLISQRRTQFRVNIRESNNKDLMNRKRLQLLTADSSEPTDQQELPRPTGASFPTVSFPICSKSPTKH